MLKVKLIKSKCRQVKLTLTRLCPVFSNTFYISLYSISPKTEQLPTGEWGSSIDVHVGTERDAKRTPVRSLQGGGVSGHDD